MVGKYGRGAAMVRISIKEKSCDAYKIFFLINSINGVFNWKVKECVCGH
jgi:hypothetical protein